MNIESRLAHAIDAFQQSPERLLACSACVITDIMGYYGLECLRAGMVSCLG